MACGPCSNCCSKSEDEEPKKGLIEPEDRGCTDIICLLFFILWWVGMFIICGVAVNTGDPNKLLYGKDARGYRCGTMNYDKTTGKLLPGGDLTGRKKLYYYKVNEDLMSPDNLKKLNSGKAEDVALSGVCLKKCPKEDTTIGGDDFGPADSGFEKGKTYTVYFDTISVLNRCVPTKPEANSTTTKWCTRPACSTVTYSEDTDSSDFNKNRSGTTVHCPSGTIMGVGTIPSGGWVLETDSEKGSIDPTMYADLTKGLEKSGKLDDPVQYSCEVEQIVTTGSGEQIPDNSGGIYNSIAILGAEWSVFVSSISSSKVEIFVFGLVFSTVLGWLYIAALRVFARCAVYTCILLVISLMLVISVLLFVKAGLVGDSITSRVASASSSYGLDPKLTGAATSNTSVYEAVAFIWAFLTLLVVILFIWLRREVNTSIVLIQEGSRALRELISMLFYPLIDTVLLVGVFCYFVLILAYIGTADPSAVADQVSADGNVTIGTYKLSDNGAVGVMAAYHLFGFLWASNLIGAIGYTAMAGAVGFWFFERNNPERNYRFPVIAGLKVTVRYHLGTVCFGSCVLAIAQFLRACVAYVAAKTKDAQEQGTMGKLLKFAICCCQCCLRCFEKTLKFVTQYCYIHTAMLGQSLCTAMWSTWTLITGHPGQMTILNACVTMVNALGCIFIPVVCTAACYGSVNYCIPEPLDPDATPPGCVFGVKDSTNINATYAALPCLLISYFISKAFTNVYSCTISTLFVSAMRDKDELQGVHCSPELREAMGLDAEVPHTGGGAKAEASI